MMRNKKGSYLTNVLFGLLLVVITGVLVLLAIKMVNYVGSIDKATCQASVEARSTFNLGPFEPGKSIPLKCKTKKICIVIGNDKCSNMVDTKASPVVMKSISENNAKIEIEDILADELFKCHQMLGAGQLDFMPHSKYTSNYCLVCSQFDFGDKTKDKISPIPYFDIYQHMQEKKTADGRNYLDYIYPGLEAGKTIEIFNMIKKSAVDLEATDTDFKDFTFEDWQFEGWGINPKDKNGYSIVAQMVPVGTLKKWVGIGATLVIGVVTIALLPTPAGPVGVALVALESKVMATVSLTASGFMFIYGDPSGKYNYIPPTILRSDADVLNSLKCTSFETSI